MAPATYGLGSATIHNGDEQTVTELRDGGRCQRVVLSTLSMGTKQCSDR